MVAGGNSVTAAQHESHGPVILLPPSTSSNNDDSLYPSVREMECGDPDDAANEDPAGGLTTAIVVPVVVARTYKIYGSGLGNLGRCSNHWPCLARQSFRCMSSPAIFSQGTPVS